MMEPLHISNAGGLRHFFEISSRFSSILVNHSLDLLFGSMSVLLAPGVLAATTEAIEMVSIFGSICSRYRLGGRIAFKVVHRFRARRAGVLIVVVGELVVLHFHHETPPIEAPDVVMISRK